MERRRSGPTNRSVPVIGQGTRNVDRGDRAAIAALRRAFPRGRRRGPTL